MPMLQGDYSAILRRYSNGPLVHKALHILNGLYDKGIELTLFFAGYYPVVFVRLTRLGTAVCLILCIEAENLTPDIFTH